MDTFALLNDGYGITFCDPVCDDLGRLDGYTVHIKDRGLHAKAEIRSAALARGPDILFSDIAQHWRGWGGKKCWHSLESDITLTATIDSHGNINIEIQLKNTPEPGGWCAVSHVYIETNQLDHLSKQAANFFGRGP